MGSFRIKNKTSYFVVTSKGKLHRVYPLVMILFTLIFSAIVTVFAWQCYFYNQQLVSERIEIQAQLAKLDNTQKQMSNELVFCEESKDKICRLLNFKTELKNAPDSLRNLNEK